MARRTAARCTTSFRNAAGVGASPTELVATERRAGPAGSRPILELAGLGARPSQATFRGQVESRSSEEGHRQRSAIDTPARAGSTPAWLAAEAYGTIAMTQGAGRRAGPPASPPLFGPWASAGPRAGRSRTRGGPSGGAVTDPKRIDEQFSHWSGGDRRGTERVRARKKVTSHATELCIASEEVVKHALFGVLRDLTTDALYGVWRGVEGASSGLSPC
jgi:hypothetical protein